MNIVKMKDHDHHLWLFDIVDAVISKLHAEKESAESQVL